MKYRISFFVILAVMLCAGFLISCEKPENKYAELYVVVDEYLAFVDEFDKALDTDDGKKAADALITFDKNIRGMESKMNDFQTKFPELTGDEIPPELEDLITKIESIDIIFAGIDEKMIKFSEHEEFKKAMEQIQGN